jgi:hypothetical protein
VDEQAFGRLVDAAWSAVGTGPDARLERDAVAFLAAVDAAAAADDPFARLTAWAAEAEERQAEREAAWERDAAWRQVAEAARRRADARRRRELGLPADAQVPIAAALDWTRPQRPAIW